VYLDILPQNLKFSHRLQVSTISLSTEFWTFELGIRLEIGSKTVNESGADFAQKNITWKKYAEGLLALYEDKKTANNQVI